MIARGNAALRSISWRYAAAGAVLLCYVVLAALYAASVPPWEAPDEVAHFDYAARLALTRDLPVQRPGQLSEAHQPPLYYVLAGLAAAAADLNDSTGAFRPNPRFMWVAGGGEDVNASLNAVAGDDDLRGHALALRLARALSTAMGFVTVALTIAIGWRVFPVRPVVGILAGALVAFNPQFLFISAAVNNDNLLFLATTGAWLQLLRTLERPEQWRQWLYVSAWLALALLAKTTGLVVCLAVGLVLVACAVQRRSARILLRGAAAATLVTAAAAGWWWYRNQIHYGDPFGWTAYRQIFAMDFRETSLEWNELPVFFTAQFRSFWGVFGWMNVAAPEWFYTGAVALCAAALLGLARFSVARLGRRLGVAARPWTEGEQSLRGQRAALLFLAATVLAQEAILLALATRCNASCYQGRYLFPVLGPVMVLTSLGLVCLPLGRLRGPAMVGLLATLVSTAAALSQTTIAAAYPSATVPTSRARQLPEHADYTFGRCFELAGYTVRTDRMASRVILTLLWRAVERPDFDYSVFAHLINDKEELVAQKDHAPGAQRRYPPTSWLPGDVVQDRHEITLPPSLPSGTYRLRIGVYNWATGERLPVRTGAAQAGGAITLEAPLYRFAPSP